MKYFITLWFLICTSTSRTEAQSPPVNLSNPAQPSEYSASIYLQLNFTNRSYIASYANVSSPESLNLFNEYNANISSGLSSYKIRVVSAVINKISNGSVYILSDYILEVAINATMNSTTLVNSFNNVTFTVYMTAVVISNSTILKEPTLVGANLTTTALPASSATSVATSPASTAASVATSTGSVSSGASTSTSTGSVSSGASTSTSTGSVSSGASTSTSTGSVSSGASTSTSTGSASSGASTSTSQITTLLTTTIIPKVPIVIGMAAQPGEYFASLYLQILFSNRTYIQAFSNVTSSESVTFFNEYYRNINSSLMSNKIRVVSAVVNSMSNGSVKAVYTLEVAMNGIMTDESLSNNFINATNSAYSSAVIINNSTVLQTSTLVTSTTAPITSTTAPITTTISTKADPVKPGERSFAVAMSCSFTDEVYTTDYNNPTSAKYIDFKGRQFVKWQAALSAKLIRLIEIIINSLSSGSVKANMSLNVASTSSISTTDLEKTVTQAAQAAYGSNIQILSISAKHTSALPKTQSWIAAAVLVTVVVVIVGLD